MKKSDLKNGMIVETIEGKRYLFMKEFMGGDDSLIRAGGHNDTCNYNEDLSHREYYCFNIVKVWSCHQGDICSAITSRDKICLNLVWERTETKEVTMADLEDMYGCKVKIIK